MAFFTKEQVKKAIRGGEAQGFSGDAVVNEMVAKGHKLEGLNAEERRVAGAFPIEQNKGGLSQVGKQLYNVGNEAFQFGKAVVTQPSKLIGGIAGVAVGAGEQLVEGVSSAVSTVGKAVGLDIPEIRIPQFHPDGTVSYEEKNKFEQLSEVIGKQSGITSLASGNPKQAFKDVEKTLFEAPLSSALDAIGVGVAKSGKLPTLTRSAKVTKEATRPGIVKTAVKGVGDELLQKSTGLGKENIQSIVRHPNLYAKADAGEITRGSIAHNVKSGIDTRLKEIGEAGRVYDDIRQSGVAVSVPKTGVQSVLKKYGLEFDDVNSRIKVGSESRPLSGSDIRELEEFFGQYGGEQLTANGFLNAREKLSQLSGFDVARTDVMNNLARDLRSHYNGVARPQVKGLKELDNAYAPEVGKLREIKKEYLRTVVDETGQRVTVLKDNAISRIMGSTNKGREEILKRLDDIAPGIGDEIRVLKALEDVQLATGNKIGTYFRSGMGVMGVATAFGPAGIATAVPILAMSILTSPSVIARVLEWYGKMKGYDAADVMLKMKRTGKLAPDELGFVQEAVRAYEKATDSAAAAKSPQAATPLGSTVKQLDSSPTTLPQPTNAVNMTDDLANLTPEERATGLIGGSDSVGGGKGVTLYHGTSDMKIAADDVMPNKRMKGLYTTTSKKAAQDYGSNVLEFKPKPNAKFLDLTDGDMAIDFMKKNGILSADDLENVDLMNYIQEGRIFQYDISSKTSYADDLVKIAKEKGYDIVKLSDDLGGEGDNIAYIATRKDALVPSNSPLPSVGGGVKQAAASPIEGIQKSASKANDIAEDGIRSAGLRGRKELDSILSPYIELKNEARFSDPMEWQDYGHGKGLARELLALKSKKAFDFMQSKDLAGSIDETGAAIKLLENAQLYHQGKPIEASISKVLERLRKFEPSGETEAGWNQGLVDGLSATTDVRGQLNIARQAIDDGMVYFDQVVGEGIDGRPRTMGQFMQDVEDAANLRQEKALATRKEGTNAKGSGSAQANTGRAQGINKFEDINPNDLPF